MTPRVLGRLVRGRAGGGSGGGAGVELGVGANRCVTVLEKVYIHTEDAGGGCE